ncbi:hypothetical protein B0A48_10998 [Cryoendolithus antarcticus]|uniref:NADH dehydrogenase [ubiquinone] 1 alpha subcomplex subunit n=1 Tax=Cryoendolithus antarcticus TaxID=1507870 RepID=A0A1V8SYZ6_9PEZI|nr:hypothetical protein B0A48_10998 [Cryoendolithus antarcticus]
MSARPPGVIKQLYFRWKALRLPWRRQFLAGADLAGNTFWEFRDALNAGRWRRIVKYNTKSHYSDVIISPQWHQWLRHTREFAPSAKEQQMDVTRRLRTTELAAIADQKWKDSESFLDAPAKQQPEPALQVKDPGGHAGQTEPESKQGVRNAVEDMDKILAAAEGKRVDEGRFRGPTKEKLKEESPWGKPARGNPDENYAPKPWTPGAAARR